VRARRPHRPCSTQPVRRTSACTHLAHDRHVDTPSSPSSPSSCRFK
jgi:hypothetical protein